MSSSARLISFKIILILPLTLMSQLNEAVLLMEFNTLRNIDFRKTTEADLDDWEIEYESDFVYEPKEEADLTFLGYPINSASFYLTNDGKIEKFGLKIYLNNVDEFYQRLVGVYGGYSVCSPSKAYFESKGFILPSQDNEEAQAFIAQLPVPDLDDYRYLNSLTDRKSVV